MSDYSLRAPTAGSLCGTSNVNGKHRRFATSGYPKIAQCRHSSAVGWA